jgi:hypothetical protein
MNVSVFSLFDRRYLTPKASRIEKQKFDPAQLQHTLQMCVVCVESDTVRGTEEAQILKSEEAQGHRGTEAQGHRGSLREAEAEAGGLAHPICQAEADSERQRQGAWHTQSVRQTLRYRHTGTASEAETHSTEATERHTQTQKAALCYVL